MVENTLSISHGGESEYITLECNNYDIAIQCSIYVSRRGIPFDIFVWKFINSHVLVLNLTFGLIIQ